MVVLITLIVVVLFYILITYNGLIKSRNSVKQSKSGIDVYLTQRFDLIPNLVECVKTYCKYEESILKEVVELRNEYNTNKELSVGEKLDKKYYNLIAIAESNPDLKASEQFLNLQKNLSKIESQIQAARRIYNSEVTRLNTKIELFPSNLIAGLFRFKKAELFEAEANARDNVKVEI